ncbi:MAG: DNA repair protein RecO [Planctomycetota bacterium]|jgi:DNA repair protein RecO (recombination protein O)
MLTKDLAICIRAVDYSETSQIVTFFTRAAGKISAIAKGSKRPKSAFDGPIEIFSHGKIVFSDSNKEKLPTLTEFESADGGPGFVGLRKNLFALNCCLFAAELLNNLTKEYDPHPELFDSFLQFLQNLNEQRAIIDERRDMLALLIFFQLILLKEVGLKPILNYCVNCKTQYAARNTQYETYFSSSANGLICRDCESSFPDKIRLTKNTAACLANLKQIAESQEKILNEIEKILIYHFTELLHRRPKMAKHIFRS